MASRWSRGPTRRSASAMAQVIVEEGISTMQTFLLEQTDFPLLVRSRYTALPASRRTSKQGGEENLFYVFDNAVTGEIREVDKKSRSHIEAFEPALAGELRGRHARRGASKVRDGLRVASANTLRDYTPEVDGGESPARRPAKQCAGSRPAHRPRQGGHPDPATIELLQVLPRRGDAARPDPGASRLCGQIGKKGSGINGFPSMNGSPASRRRSSRRGSSHPKLALCSCWPLGWHRRS